MFVDRRATQLLCLKFDETTLVGDAVFTELLGAVVAADADEFDVALLRLTSLVAAFVDSIVIESFKSRQDRRHWLSCWDPSDEFAACPVGQLR